MSTLVAARTRFVLPPDSEATEPPEHRGLERDQVRLLVARRGSVDHRRFRDLDRVLAPGDLLVVNTSPTAPAALDAVLADGRRIPLHVATQMDDGRWVVEPRRPDGSGPLDGLVPGTSAALPGGVRVRLDRPYPSHRPRSARRLWTASPSPAVSLGRFLADHGRPITYGYLRGRFPITDYQTTYARPVPDGGMGSAEMASAGRPLTAAGITRLVAAGVTVAPVVLHAGVSSPEVGEPPTPERFAVPEATARLVNLTRAAGGRIVAVGTTVVRALESAVDPEVARGPGPVVARAGWTDLVLGPRRPARVVDGLVTGLHEPEASHLLLLEAVAGDLVADAYAEVARGGYLWHEFGDSMLLLP